MFVCTVEQAFVFLLGANETVLVMCYGNRIKIMMDLLSKTIQDILHGCGVVYYKKYLSA